MCSCLWQAATRLPKNKVRATIPSWTLKLSDFKQEKRKVTCFFSLSPVNSSIPPNCADDLIICSCVLQALPPLRSQGLTSGVEPCYLGLTHLEVTVFENGGFFGKPLLLLFMQPSGREVFSNFVPWEVDLWSSYNKDLQGRTVRSGLVFQVLFLFSHLHSWAISDLTL